MSDRYTGQLPEQTAAPTDNDLMIVSNQAQPIATRTRRFTFGRLKTWVWNLILPWARAGDTSPVPAAKITKAEAYPAVKAVMHPDTQSAVTADDANSELDIADRFAPTQANLYPAIKAVMHPGDQSAVTADDANSEIDIATADLTQAALYPAVKEILHPSDQAAVTADDANNEIDIAPTAAPVTSHVGALIATLAMPSGTTSFSAQPAVNWTIAPGAPAGFDLCLQRGLTDR